MERKPKWCSDINDYCLMQECELWVTSKDGDGCSYWFMSKNLKNINIVLREILEIMRKRWSNT